MKSASSVLTSGGRKRDVQRVNGGWIFPLIALVLLFLSGPLIHAQTTAQLTGTVQDSSGAVIPAAQVTLTDEASGLPASYKRTARDCMPFPRWYRAPTR